MRRILIGIDRPVNKDKVAEYVLTNFTHEEQQTVDIVIRNCIQSLSDDVRNKFGVDLLQINKENVD
jgi:peptidyl-tRNA hydrolase